MGQVENYELHDGYVDINIYIEEEYAGLVLSESNFWRASGVELVLNAKGVRLSAASVDTLLRGGIKFETPIGKRSGKKVEDGATFKLYDHHDDVSEEYIGASYEIIMYYESSVRGLEKGAPVEFRGIKLGVVTDVSLEYDISANGYRFLCERGSSPSEFD